MRKTILALALALLAPSAAHAACTVATDPAGDTRSQLGLPRADGQAIDLLSVELETQPDDLIVRLGVVDVDGPFADHADHAELFLVWWIGDDRYEATAKRDAAGWTFTAMSGTVPITGSVDVVQDVVTMVVPRSIMGSPPNGTVLERIGATGEESSTLALPGVPVIRKSEVWDLAPEDPDHPLTTYTLGGSC
jgi:hypothetical protein